ncbi:MAG: hypothetical protein E7487_03275 [Ruminococcaceae bacterium]|nr:hypothetical protein [Oscillospiraceae bacterium]
MSQILCTSIRRSGYGLFLPRCTKSIRRRKTSLQCHRRSRALCFCTGRRGPSILCRPCMA